ncbi:MAG: ABC transporter ATP-binding protein [Thermoleophilia bacterium]|nr:ABC transporter ATP-binding protein [Thermoleophilia bacterium]
MVTPTTGRDLATVGGPGRGPLLEISHLSVRLRMRSGPITVVDDVSLEIGSGEILGLVGESGCGKSMTALAIMRLLPEAAEIAGGSVLLDGEDLVRTKPERMRQIRGAEVAMVFQEPMTSLDPAFTVGHQVVEAVRAHEKVSRAVSLRRAEESFERVGIPKPRERFDAYPHQLSGGLCQRVMLAMALVTSPRLLIADEPTTALDVTIQAQILELIKQLRTELNLSVLWISHDFGVVSEIADRVAVMYAGEIVEIGETSHMLGAPRHRYTRALIDSIPGRGEPRSLLRTIPGQVPDPGARPAGCRFSPRCDAPVSECELIHPELRAERDASSFRCHNPVA